MKGKSLKILNSFEIISKIFSEGSDLSKTMSIILS